jgi:hypothetical protein
MSDNKQINKNDELKEFKSFIKKKKAQNEALKKIFSRLDSNKKIEPNK